MLLLIYSNACVIPNFGSRREIYMSGHLCSAESVHRFYEATLFHLSHSSSLNRSPCHYWPAYPVHGSELLTFLPAAARSLPSRPPKHHHEDTHLLVMTISSAPPAQVLFFFGLPCMCSLARGVLFSWVGFDYLGKAPEHPGFPCVMSTVVVSWDLGLLASICIDLTIAWHQETTHHIPTLLH